MANLTIRNLPDEVHRAIKLRATEHGRSTEAEVRAILLSAAQQDAGLRFGDELASLGAALGGLDIEVERSDKPMRAAAFR